MVKHFSGEGDIIAWLVNVKLVARLQNIPNLACFIPLFLEWVVLALYLQLSEDDQRDAEGIENALKKAFSEGMFCRIWKPETD